MIKYLTRRSAEEIKVYELEELEENKRINKRINRFHKYNKSWKPFNEYGEITLKDFNKRFLIDKNYLYYTPLKKYRIRFVQHSDIPKDSVRISTYSFYKRIIFWRWEKVFFHPTQHVPKHVYQTERVMKIDECEKVYGIKLI